MMIFKDVKKSRATETIPKMKRGSVPAMQSKSGKKKLKRTTPASEPCSPKVKKVSARGSFDNKETETKKKIKKMKTTGRTLADLGSIQKRNVGMDYNQQDMDALTPREVAAVQYISDLCADNETSKILVVRTNATAYHALSASDLKGHIIPRITEESDIEKYICNGVIDAYAGYLSLQITDKRCFKPAWHAFILSNEYQVDRILKPENRQPYVDFATKFYDHDLVFFPLQLLHRGHKHWILVVMNNKIQEFQVLDSLWTPDMYMNKIESMRTGIERMTNFARRRSPHLPTDVGTWKISPIDNLPKQTDGTSCGLFVIKYMELWNGTRLLRDFTQDEVHIFRMSMIADMIFPYK